MSSASMGKTTPSSLNSSVSNSIITNATGSSQQHQQQHQSSSHQQQQQQQHQQLPHPIFPAAAHLPAKLMNSKRKHAKYNSMYSPHMYPDHNNYLHLNSLWSIWYGVLLTLFQGYLAVHGAYRFLGCSLISWKIEPVSELNLQIILSGVVFILLPFFFTSAVFKVGNLANDGIKLATGAKERRCSMVPHDGLEEESRGGTLRALWTHGGPTAAFVHIVIAMCLLLPRLLLEARIIENALLPQETIWQTELDFMTINRRNLVVLSVVTAPYQNHTQQQLYGSQEEDDYYNDTMFTDGSGAGVDTSGINGVGVSNHLLDNEAKQQYEKKHKTLKEVIGKISFFEASDLINRSSVLVDDEQMQQQQFNNVSNMVSNKNDQELINKWLRVPAVTTTTTAATDAGIASTTENIEHLNSSILSFIINTVNISQDNENMGQLNQMIANTSSSTTTTTTTTTIRNNNSNDTITDDEDDSKMPMTSTTTINAEDLEEDDKNTATTIVTTTTTTTTTTTENIDMGTTIMAAELNKTSVSMESMFSIALITGNKDNITAMTRRKDKTSNGTSTLATANNENHNNNNKSIDILMVNKEGLILTHIEEHHEHQHQHQHAHKHQHQHQHPHRQHQHLHHGNHTSKPARKHGHHRPRKLSSSVGSRKHQQQQQHTDDASRYPPLNLNSKNKNDDMNRVDEIDRLGSPGGIVFEHTAGGVRTAASLNELDFGRARAAIYPKSSTTISTTTRDSNIHIVKPERLPEIIPSTPLASNSKIIEIKTKPSNKIKRATVEIEPQYLVGDLALNDSTEYIAEVGSGIPDVSITSSSSVSSSNSDASADQIVRLDGFAGMLQLFFGIEKQIDVDVFNHPPSAEFVNLMFALMVWCVRYPAVFWTTAKSFATIFSVQIIAAASDIIFSFVGISTLYKLQIYSEAQPIQNPGLILNATVTLSLFLLSAVLMISSSMIMYLYGHGRLAAKMRDRSLITLKSSETWIYFAHCASLCYVLALAVVKAPLLNDLSATYRQNLHCPTFMAALVSVMHLLLWIVIWLGLSAKRRWSFKLPPLDAYGIIGKATTQPLLMHNRGGLSNANTSSGPAATLANGMVLGGGSSLDQKNTSTSIITGNGGGGGGGGSSGGVGVGGSIVGSLVGGIGSSCVLNTSNNHHHLSNTSTCDAMSDAPADDIYWPKLTPSSPKLKVTFNEVPSTCDDDQLLIGDHEQNDGKRSSPRGTTICFTGATGEIDDGEYATLRLATAATVVGIALGSGSGAANKGGSSTTQTAPAGGVNVLHFGEFDELPPPPPPSTHMMSSMTITNHTTAVSVNVSSGADYVNCITALMSSGDDNISEESKLLACVRDDSVTYASTRDLEPPLPPLPPPPPSHTAHYVDSSRAAPHAMPEIMQVSSSSPEHLVSPLAPVTVTVHTNEAHITSSSTTRCLRRADSGVPQEALTPRSDTTSMGTESTTSPPERALSESSSGVHSSEERDMEVVIRPRAVAKPPVKPPQPAIQEEPYGRCTNMRMTSFAGGVNINSATLPMQRTAPEQKFDYSQHCSTMPLPTASHSYTHPANQTPAVYATSAQSMTQSQHQTVTSNVSSFKTPHYANASVALQCLNIVQPPPLPPSPSVTHTVLPNGARYSNPNILKRLPHVKAAESPYGYSGLGPGHYTFSKPGYENSLVNTSIPEDRDSANYSMTSEQDCLYTASNALQ